jgi:hypothetical protein
VNQWNGGIETAILQTRVALARSYYYRFWPEL